MSRIRKAYEAQLRSLLLRLHARKLESGVSHLTDAARQLGVRNNLPPAQALVSIYERTRGQVRRWEQRTARTPPGKGSSPTKFLCDAGLGGLARWLRAAGYEAIWFPDIDDADLLRKARELNSTVLTTDSLMMQRGVLRDGIIPALWLPPAITIQEQLALVFREFDLEIRPPRCMCCGGTLRRVEKESVRDRIPPKTWRWIDDYFVCAECSHLFWQGTHWRRISQELQTATM